LFLPGSIPFCSEIDAAYEHAVANGARPHQAPASKPWGQNISYVLDNNGMRVELATPMG